MNWLAWDGERHIPFDYDLFKHLCIVNGYDYVWTERVNKDVRIKEVGLERRVEFI